MNISPRLSPIVDKIQTAVSGPKFSEFAQNTIYAVTIETGLKMVGRPSFIFMDKEADKKSKKYASVKEFLYQATCLGLYLGIVPFVKKGLYKAISGFLSGKNPLNKESLAEYEQKLHEIDNLHHAAKDKIKAAVSKIDKEKIKESLRHEVNAIKKELKVNQKYHLGKGAKELSAIIGSVLTLAIMAPQLSHYIVHPMMKALGFDKKHDAQKH